MGWKIYLPGDFCNTTVSKSSFGKILGTLQSDSSSDEQIYIVVFDPYMIGGTFKHGDIERMLVVELIDSCQKFLFSKCIIFIRHAHIPQDIFISKFRHEPVSWELHAVIIRPDCSYLKFTCRAIKVDFKIIGTLLFIAKSA